MALVPLFCSRCAAELTPGHGDFYALRIVALADPTPPVLERAGSPQETAAEIRRLIQTLRGMSPQEALDGVYRTLMLYLCRRCYDVWIENPTGVNP